MVNNLPHINIKTLVDIIIKYRYNNNIENIII